LLYKNYSFNDNIERNILQMGDQNEDGYDDFIAYNCFRKGFTLFYGGNPIDTLKSIYFNYAAKGGPIAIDLNGDGKKDLILWEGPSARKFLIFYGGTNIDTIPDLEFRTPKNISESFGLYIYNAGDFNGDGRDDLIIQELWQQFSVHINQFYFFSTYPVFDTIPEMVFGGDSLKIIDKQVTSFGDINGDGLNDFIYKGVGPNYNDTTRFMGIVLGNQNWDTTSVVTYYQKKQSFDVERIRFINDINNDGKDDVLMDSYGSFHPYYYRNFILYGKIPLDTIPDVGLNTQNTLILDEVGIGDVNGDGYKDFLSLSGFGYPIAKLWLGGRNMNNHNLPVRRWGASEDFFGGMINKLGDVNGDGVNDFTVGTASMTGSCREVEGYFVIFKGDTSVTTGTEEEQNGQPEEFELYEPYPNPFNPVTILQYKIGSLSDAEIKVYDTLGQQIAVLLNEEKPAGKHKIEFNADKYKLSSGVYFINIKFKEGGKSMFSQTKKVTLIK
jgi:hypothetical protein